MNNENEYVTCNLPNCDEMTKKELAVYVDDKPHCSVAHAKEAVEAVRRERSRTFFSVMTPGSGDNGPDGFENKKLNKILSLNSKYTSHL